MYRGVPAARSDMSTYDPAMFRGERVLITGGAGFIGSHLAERLLHLGAKVVILDDLSSGFASNVPDDAVLISGSIADMDAVEHATEHATYVFHEAAMVSVPESVEQPKRCFDINIRGTSNVLDAARRLGVKRLVQASSAAVYGGNPTLPCQEDQPVDCWSPYAASKASCEALASGMARCFPLETVSLRYFNIFGPRQDPHSAYAAVISAFAHAYHHGEQARLFGDGGQTRDFTYIDNVVDANLLAATSPRVGAGEAINVGTGRRIALRTVLDAMWAIGGRTPDPSMEPERAGDIRDSVASIERATELLGYQPTVSFEDGLKRFMG